MTIQSSYAQVPEPDQHEKAVPKDNNTITHFVYSNVNAHSYKYNQKKLYDPLSENMVRNSSILLKDE